MDHGLGVGPGPGRDQAGPQQQRAGQLQRVVEPLALGPVVLRARLLAQRLKHRADRGGALAGQVTADHPGAAERGTQLHEPVARVGLVRVGLLPPPCLDRAGGDGGQVV